MKSNSNIFCIVLSLCLLAMASTGWTSPAVKLEILFMNHGPMQPTIRNLKNLLAEYNGKVEHRWFDADLDSGKEFMKKKNIRGHIPLLILVNDEATFVVDGKETIFRGFPTGAAPFKAVEGNWSISDLRRLLDHLTK